ncbi:hypothetical protein Tco_1386297 [Tanacetum coccineum]
MMLRCHTYTLLRPTSDQILQVFIEEEFNLNRDMTWRTTQWEWSTDIIPDSVIPCFLPNQSINIPLSPVYESREFSGGGTKLEAKADAQLLLGTGRLDEGIDHAGTDEVAGLNLDVVVVQAMYSVEAVVLDEPGAAEL